MLTYYDAVEYLIRAMNNNQCAATRLDAKTCILDALRQFSACHPWQYYRQHGRIATVAPYSTGTIAFDFTGGVNERMVTLSSGTWPAWAQYGVLLISNVVYKIDRRISDTVVTLTEALNPGADIASGTSYTLYRDTYPLPDGCRAIDYLYPQNQCGRLGPVPPDEWLDITQGQVSPGTPAAFCITGDPDQFGGMAVRFCPPPLLAQNYDFMYRRHPRELLIENQSTGTIATTAASATVTGTGTAFSNATHVGCVIRKGDASNVPTAIDGAYPYAEERMVVAVASATSLTVNEAFSATASGVKFMISDPVDVDVEVMGPAFKRHCERLFANFRQLTARDSITAQWREDLRLAMAADKRFVGQQSVGGPPRRVRWGTTRGDDIE